MNCWIWPVKNKLSDPATLEKQVRRMLADPRSKTLASNFVFQWLEMKRLDDDRSG